MFIIVVSEAKNLKVKSSGNFFAIASMEHDVVLTRTVTANNNDPLWAEAHQMCDDKVSFSFGSYSQRI